MENELIFEPEQEILVAGETTDLPETLYIPPDALRVVLDSFSGPLDLLLYLIRKQNIDVLDIPIAQITEQYMQYVEMMKEDNLELAAEYLLMAAILGEIKSRVLLPRQSFDTDEEDPRAELIRRLQEYERFKHASNHLDQLPRMNRDIFASNVYAQLPETKVLVTVTMQELLQAFLEVSKRSEFFNEHNVLMEPLSVRERMIHILSNIQNSKTCQFSRLFTVEEGKSGVVVTFLAVLELLREQLIEIVQNQHYSEIYLQARGS